VGEEVGKVGQFYKRCGKKGGKKMAYSERGRSQEKGGGVSLSGGGGGGRVGGDTVMGWLLQRGGLVCGCSRCREGKRPGKKKVTHFDPKIAGKTSQKVGKKVFA